MPLYEYVCTKCDSRFEELRPSSRMDDPARCPSGHNAGQRVLSAFATIGNGGSVEPEPMDAGSGGCGGCAGGCTCGAN